jgi:DNA anti-recombination protein RmuC
VLLAVLLVCVCVDGWQIRKERKRAAAREAELTRRIDEARMMAHKRAEELNCLIGDVRQTLQERWDAYTEQIAALSKTVAEIPTDQLQEIYDSEKQFQAGLNAIMNFGQQSYGLNKGGDKT